MVRIDFQLNRFRQSDLVLALVGSDGLLHLRLHIKTEHRRFFLVQFQDGGAGAEGFEVGVLVHQPQGVLGDVIAVTIVESEFEFAVGFGLAA